MTPAEYAPRPQGPVRGSIRPPGSKSITNRALVCAALAGGTSRLTGCLDSEDTQVMRGCWEQLGVAVRGDTAHVLEVTGCAGAIPAHQADLDVVNSGTTIRFLTAVVAAATGSFRLDGNPRMRQRPIGDLVDALRQLGVDVRATDNRFPPVSIKSRGLPGGSVSLRADVSSQYLSGLLLAAPSAQAPLTIRLDGPLVSKPYVDMTVAVMRAFGVQVDTTSPNEYRIDAPCRYHAVEYPIEPDATAAGYFWAAAAVTGGEVLVRDLHWNALQGDVRFCRCLEQMGCTVEDRAEGLSVRGGFLHGIDIDMADISDTVLTLAVVALFADSPTRIRGVGHIRHKESDRIGDLARELRKLGADVDEHEDGLTIRPRPLKPARIATYDDHRMAMSFAVAGLKQPGVVIEDPRCVEKTYPHFFADLESLARR